MKNKRFLSTVVVSALVASTMVMPVMAADGGEVDVDVSTRTAVIRVEVPTSLEVAVNQFEKGDSGSQIYSGNFGIKNKSEIPVKLTVTSTAGLASTNPISLVATKAAAENSEDAEAWMAVAAEIDDGKYFEDGKTIKDLTESSYNVTTFVQGTETAANSGTAEQVFYLGANATPTVTYQKLAPTTEAAVKTAKDTSYAQIHLVEAVNFTDAADTDVSQPELDTAIEAADVYAEASDGTITLIQKGTNATFTSGVTYYEDKGAVVRTAIEKDKIYVYGEAGVGGTTAFRYIGRLSEGKETWTKDDISTIKIAYDINGVTATKYAEISADTESLKYGLYKEPIEPENQNVLTTDGTTDVVIYYTGETPTTVTITPISTPGTQKTPLELSTTRTDIFSVADDTVTIKASWLASLKPNAKFGAGTYKVTINGTDNTMTIQ